MPTGTSRRRWILRLTTSGRSDYWTRVNYGTLFPPGKSTLVLPLAQLYVGEKARPGRNLMLGGITRLVLSIGDKPHGPVYLDNIRLERDTETAGVLFDGLYAFDLGPSTGPLDARVYPN